MSLILHNEKRIVVRLMSLKIHRRDGLRVSEAVTHYDRAYPWPESVNDLIMLFKNDVIDSYHSSDHLVITGTVLVEFDTSAGIMLKSFTYEDFFNRFLNDKKTQSKGRKKMSAKTTKKAVKKDASKKATKTVAKKAPKGISKKAVKK